MDAPAADGDAGTNLEEFKPDLAEGGRSQIGAAQHLGPQHREQEMGEGRKPEPELVGGHPARAGALGKEVLLCLLDAIFHFSARAVKLLVECGGCKALFGLADEAFSGKVGNHKARIRPFGQDLGFAHHPARAAPTLARARFKVLKAAARHWEVSGFDSLVKLSEALAQAGAQPLIARSAQAVRDCVLLAPRHDLLTGESAVGSHNDAHPAPKAPPDGATDFLERLHRAAAGISQSRQERDIATKAVEWQITVAAVVTVEESSFLVAMQRVVGGVKIQDNLPA